jgi:soluble lytic murein transglycosylase-like protein
MAKASIGAPYGRRTSKYFQWVRKTVGLNATLCFSAFLVVSVSPLSALAYAPEMVQRSATRLGVPVGLAMAIAQKESGTRCGVIGRRGERGPMQVLPATARHLGYPNIAKASCERQIDAAMAYLKFCYEEAGRDYRRTAACYNAGPRALTWRRLPKSVDRYVVAVLD